MVDLVTITNFADSIEANLAKQDLEAEGITAFLADETTVNIAWYLTVAIKWVKLQVPELEAEQAISILSSARVADHLLLPESTEPVPGETEAEDVVRLSWADRTVERMFRAAVLGLVFLPLQLYSLWLLIRLLVSGRRIHRSRYRQFVIAIISNVPILVTLGAIFL